VRSNSRLRSIRSSLQDVIAPVPTIAWDYAQLAGRFVELSGTHATAVLTSAFGLVLEAQRAEEPVAWVALAESSFFPPDAAEGGADLHRLPLVRVPDGRTAGWAADQLVRSGGFGLVVLDLGGVPRIGAPPRKVPEPLQQRLVGLAQKHATAVVVLTDKPADAPSLGSLVSLRAEAQRAPRFGLAAPESAGFPCRVEVRVLKDKRRGPGRTSQEICHGPAGLY
jgi:recombination protein RecA